MQEYFYYSGDTAAFNAFAKRYSQVQVPEHVLVLHSGQGSVEGMFTTPLNPSGSERPTYTYDWAVTGGFWQAQTEGLSNTGRSSWTSGSAGRWSSEVS